MDSLAARAKEDVNSTMLIQKKNISKEDLKFLSSLLDLTSLNDFDSEKTIQLLYKSTTEKNPYDLTPYAFCIFPTLIENTQKILKKSDYKIATVIGGFPHGQVSLQTKIAECKEVLGKGVNEVDLTLNRSFIKNNELEKTCEEIKAIASLCHKKNAKITLKVIIETGELSLKEIQETTWNAFINGADLVKTSTGKGALPTLEEIAVVLRTTRAYKDLLKKANLNEKHTNIGVKVSGGVKTVEQAYFIVTMAAIILGENLSPNNFRIGASSLYEQLKNYNIKSSV